MAVARSVWPGSRIANRVHDGDGGRFVETGIAQRGEGSVIVEGAALMVMVKPSRTREGRWQRALRIEPRQPIAGH